MLDQLVREIRAILQEAARESLSAGWAELRSEFDVEPALFLEPMRLEAAPLVVHFDSEDMLLCSPGRSGMMCEFFTEEGDDLHASVRGLATAVVAGNYSERVRLGSVAIEAKWLAEEREVTMLHNVLEVPGSTDKGWRSVSYEPF
ncbi:MAG TPA: hypothetical protein VK480_09450 [Solirubrobacterales bacterium]|nr:hypothetical protein [Solirubrobacterales bacterium]